MIRLQNILLLTLLCVSVPALAKEHVVILATGGTIAGKQASKNDPGYKAGSFKVQDLVDAVPELKEVAELSGQQVANIGSQDMNNEVWLKLARRVNEVASQPDVDGIVITHGTDTLEETAYFLNLVVDTKKPVVLTASMRPATSISADGPMNLYQSVVVATRPEAVGRGVLCVLNDEIHYAAEITKTHTVNPGTMQSPNRGLAGKCDAEVCTFFSPTIRRHTTDSEFKIPADLDDLPAVEIVYAHVDMKRNMIDAAVKSGAKGIVIAGVGDGNMSQEALEAAAEHAKNGVIIVRSSHVGAGIVKRNVEVNDDENGFVASRELNPQKARILVQLALLQDADVDDIQEMFLKY
ncbi:type II asparaginase [Allorhodopirellula solitaria]|uniref:L-asparaginase n=1 Tax=Allorhodopirellula solitaria TaxID=2527987 RepID=A0A5C5XR39_9BACT|nr:type II asparaginase [Allorhodopirellula solitaria]TWT65364.1 L-asparaginase [Allorhodopirellula solitaria]